MNNIASWQIYRAAISIGDDQSQIAKELGVSLPKLEEILAAGGEHKQAYDTAIADRMPACIQDLSEDAKALWQILTDNKVAGDAKQQALIAVAEGGKREQQKLLLYGLVESHFDVNAALKAMKIPMKTFLCVLYLL